MKLNLEDRLNVDPSVFIAPSAIVLGDVSIGQRSSIWFQCLLRGDSDQIIIGDDCNIQDGSILHVDEGSPIEIGNRVSFGHCVMAHGCTIDDDVLVGIRATILNGAKIGKNCLIAAGSMVLENAVIPPNSIVLGLPGKVVGEVSERHLMMIKYTYQHYVEAAQKYKKILPEWQPLPKNL